MAQNNTDENQPSNLSNKSFHELFGTLARENGFVRYKIEEGDQSVKGDNYMGSVKGFNIVGVDKDNKNKCLNIVVKVASKSTSLRSQIDIPSVYQREAYTYNTLFPVLQEFELKKGLPVSFIGPKFYKSCLEDMNEAIVMENLKEIGYKMYDRTKEVDEEHLKLVLKHYAKYHALSFALRDQNLKQYEEIIKPLQANELYVQFIKEAGLVSTLENHLEDALKCLDSDADKLSYNVFKNFAEHFENTLFEVQNLPYQHSAILHGDNWINNMMFKYGDSDNAAKVTSVRFIDFQFSRIGPPPIDLSYFFYTSCTKNALNKLEDFLRLYHDTLSSYLIELGSHPEKVYPYQLLKEQWNRYAKFGLLMAVSTIRVMLSGSDEATDLAEVAESNKNVGEAFIYKIAKMDEYNARIKSVILHFVDNRFI